MGHHFFLIFCPAYHEHALDLGTPKTFKYNPLKPSKLKKAKKAMLAQKHQQIHRKCS